MEQLLRDNLHSQSDKHYNNFFFFRVWEPSISNQTNNNEELPENEESDQLLQSTYLMNFPSTYPCGFV